MAKVLLDACVPQWLRREFPGHDIETAHYARLDQIPDGELIDVAECRYDILVTLDRSLTAEQKIQKRKLAVIVLRVGSQSPEAFHALVPALRRALSDARPGDVVVVTA